MEFEPRYEDDRVRITRANKEQAERFAPDPTVLSLDAATEEPFESRVYALSDLSLLGLVAREVAGDPAADPTEVMHALVESNPTMRFVAKRDRATGRVTYLLVGTVAGTRTLLDRRDLVTPRSFRRAVRRFEDDMLKTWYVEDPSVITVGQWREYDAKATGEEPEGPATPA